MKRHSWTGKLLIAAVLCGLASVAAAQDLVHVISGEVTKIDKDAKTIAVKTADGTEHVFKYTEKTSVKDYKDAKHEVKKGGMDAYFKGKEGSHVVVRYTDKGADKVADSFDDFGKDSMKESKGTITKIDKAGHTLKIKADDGSEQTYAFGKDAAHETDKGVMKGWDYTASKAKEGDKVVVHYTEDAGKKVIHFFE